MTNFSVIEAIAEPFRQAGRRPLATVIWGLVLLAPTALVMAAIVPLFLDFLASGGLEQGPGAEVSPFDDDFAAMMQFQIWSQLANIAQLFTVLLVTTAIIRAVFANRGGDRFAFLRIGMPELHVAVVGVTVGIGMILLIIVVAMLAVAAALAMSGAPDPWRTLIYVGMGVVLAVGCLAVWGRLALLAPASIRYNTFAFVEGWRLGRGQTLRLLGVMILLFLIGVVLAIAVVLLAMIIAMAASGSVGLADPEAFAAWLEGLPGQPALMIGLGLLLLLPMAWLQGFGQLMTTAPFARAASDLSAGLEAPPSANSADTAPIAD